MTVDGLHNTANCWVTRQGDKLSVLLTNHALPEHPLSAEKVTLTLTGIKPPQRTTIERIDDEHANPRALWEDWGKPDYLGYDQVTKLNEASRLQPETLAWRTTDTGIVCNIQLPAHSVAALTLDFANHDQS